MMATMAHADVRDVQSANDRDGLTAIAARNVPATRGPSLPLPTPPNSISPSLQPHGLKAQMQRARLGLIDSDLDLQDSPNVHHNPSALGSPPPSNSASAITPAMLARHHLPDILLSHGPLAIRHIMGYLTTSVPRFADIPPAKARRLVVSALEGRGNGSDVGDLSGLEHVEFEKVGWGRWDAKLRGPARRASPTSAPSATGIPISSSAGWGGDRSRLMLPRSLGYTDSTAFSHDDRDMTMLDHEADKMSMDGSASASCSEAPDDGDDDVDMNDDPEDVTDDEDWAAIGAAALRASSYSNSSFRPPGNHSSFLIYSSGGGGYRTAPAFSGATRAPPPHKHDFSATALAATSDAQERDAVEALLKLGSV